ncbi:MAG: tRNA preQ1(34) S-adenosylmethionine ribosyltransferase-isomerase QueA [Ectothiorhodospiraceae bacterium]|nr:tRNA preQ1(34) S-adenosylmethionine ribosyltransferase-isomerase QueA [Ectothiorhodospiraceae bacterium]
MLTRDLHFDLPEALIAQVPLAERRASRLLVLDAAAGLPLEDRRFVDVVELLRPGDLLVVNDTRVVPARLHGRKDSGGAVEVLVERIHTARRFRALVRASKAPRVGSRIVLGTTTLAVVGRDEAFFELEVEGDRPLVELLLAEGDVPLPPYIRRAPDADDSERYQTVYAARPGAVAAPTAGLHFDTDLLAAVAARGVETARVTLHVGAGTFQPVRTERLEDHVIHGELVEVGEATVAAVAAARARGGRVVAVGTTTVRALESAAGDAGAIAELSGETRLFITPGYRFRCVDAMITNFHLPGSTLLGLVCAFAGVERTLAAYRHAVDAGYRFFSYGDAMLVTRAPT